MTIYRRLNQAGQGGHYTTWWLIKTLLDAGWTVPASGSGTGGLYDTSNVFDPAQSPQYYTALTPNGVGIGSEPWGWQACWICMEDPGGNRQFVLQRSGSAGIVSDGTWSLWFSPSGRFGEGQTPGTDWDENTAIDAPDRATIRSGFAAFTNNASGTLSHVAVDDTPSPEGEYGFFCVELKTPNAIAGGIMFDDVRSAPVGSLFPLTMYMANNEFCSAGPLHAYSGNDAPGTVVAFGTTAERYLGGCAYCDYWGYSSLALPNNGGTGVDGKERALPIVAISPNEGPKGYLGVSRWLRTPSVTRGYPNTANSQIYLYINGVLVVDLWDGVTTPGTV